MCYGYSVSRSVVIIATTTRSFKKLIIFVNELERGSKKTTSTQKDETEIYLRENLFDVMAAFFILSYIFMSRYQYSSLLVVSTISFTKLKFTITHFMLITKVSTKLEFFRFRYPIDTYLVLGIFPR